ncbi:MAG: pyridoxamine 5'-phosphate oxidase family protein [Bacteroidetes bacterium]|nr:pyridoxamine 5'-phosphate oxidase family protein [Bacteroidota bacterium]MCW5894527.1 pyridoxamine 5'-phosphate oxidase family protein [Bacteroidota bacterium]
MSPQSQRTLLNLIRATRTAALGTLRSGAPEVSMVLFAASAECTDFYLHISRLAHHTQNILYDARVSLMLAEADDGSRNPLTLARVSIQGEALRLEEGSPEYEAGRSAYLDKFPDASMNFSLGDFGLYFIEPFTARFVAGFGKIFNLTLQDFRKMDG